MAERGTPFSKVAKIEVASVITDDELSTPLKITTASYPLIGKEVPVIRIVVVESTVAPVTDGEFALSCSKLHSADLRSLKEDLIGRGDFHSLCQASKGTKACHGDFGANFCT